MAGSYGAVAPDTGVRPPRFTGTEADNAPIWDGQKRKHYEVWYLTLNHRASRTGFWIRYILEAPVAGRGEPYAEVWFAFFDAADPQRNFGLHQRYPLSAFRAQATPFAVGIGPHRLGHDAATGALAGNGHEARWNLSWLPAQHTYRQLPDLIYKTTFADTRVLTPNLDVPFRGTITVDGRDYVCDGEPGGQTHLWGRKHAAAWAWGHCNAFEGRRGAALETLSARLERRGVLLPPLTVVGLELDGERLAWNGVRHLPLGRGRWSTARYAFQAASPEARIEGEYTCRPEDMILAEYADPDGDPCFCANTEVADLRVRVWRRSLLGRFKEAARLSAPQTGHFEIAARQPDAAITRKHVLLSD